MMPELRTAEARLVWQGYFARVEQLLTKAGSDALSAITLFDVVICTFGEGRRAIDGWFTRGGFGTR